MNPRRSPAAGLSAARGRLDLCWTGRSCSTGSARGRSRWCPGLRGGGAGPIAAGRPARVPSALLRKDAT